jgi:hypothetical protein
MERYIDRYVKTEEKEKNRTMKAFLNGAANGFGGMMMKIDPGYKFGGWRRAWETKNILRNARALDISGKTIGRCLELSRPFSDPGVLRDSLLIAATKDHGQQPVTRNIRIEGTVQDPQTIQFLQTLLPALHLKLPLGPDRTPILPKKQADGSMTFQVTGPATAAERLVSAYLKPGSAYWIHRFPYEPQNRILCFTEPGMSGCALRSALHGFSAKNRFSLQITSSRNSGQPFMAISNVSGSAPGISNFLDHLTGERDLDGTWFQSFCPSTTRWPQGLPVKIKPTPGVAILTARSGSGDIRLTDGIVRVPGPFSFDRFTLIRNSTFLD